MLTVDVVGTGRTTGNVRPNRSKMGWKRVPGDHQGGRAGKFAAAEAVTTAIHLQIGRKFAYSAVNRGRIGRLSGKCLLRYVCRKAVGSMSMGDTLKVLNDMVTDGVIDNYAIAGAVAALQYIEPTVTEDLDILISFEDQSQSGLVTLGPIVGYLESKGYSKWEKEGLLIEGWPVQFLPVSDALDEEAIRSAETIEDDFGSSGLVSTRVLTAEYIVTTALRTGRSKDYLRINAFLDQSVVDLNALKIVLERHNLMDEWETFCQKAGLSDPLAAVCKP